MYVKERTYNVTLLRCETYSPIPIFRMSIFYFRFYVFKTVTPFFYGDER